MKLLFSSAFFTASYRFMAFQVNQLEETQNTFDRVPTKMAATGYLDRLPQIAGRQTPAPDYLSDHDFHQFNFGILSRSTYWLISN